MLSDEPFDLTRFLSAQEAVYGEVLDELRAGRKRSHWMWFIFPQLEGLGSSPTARHYAIRGDAEARAYLAHPVLGARLRECASIAAAIPEGSARDVFGTPDDLKLRSSMTLFERAASDGSSFARVLERFYSGERDARTLALLDSANAAPG